jgi:hypothetical protein
MVEEIPAGEEVLVGTFYLFGHPIISYLILELHMI